MTAQELEDIMDTIYERFDIHLVNAAFRNNCNWNDVEGLYFYNTDNPNDWIWGQDMVVWADSLNRDNIDFRSTNDPIE